MAKIKILSSLIGLFEQQILINKDLLSTSPGNFLKFNYMFNEKLSIEKRAREVERKESIRESI